MGNTWENSTLEKEEILSAIKKINETTKKIVVIEFICVYLEFY